MSSKCFKFAARHLNSLFTANTSTLLKFFIFSVLRWPMFGLLSKKTNSVLFRDILELIFRHRNLFWFTKLLRSWLLNVSEFSSWHFSCSWTKLTMWRLSARNWATFLGLSNALTYLWTIDNFERLWKLFETLDILRSRSFVGT